jgi:hypothetical protein
VKEEAEVEVEEEQVVDETVVVDSMRLLAVAVLAKKSVMRLGVDEVVEERELALAVVEVVVDDDVPVSVRVRVWVRVEDVRADNVEAEVEEMEEVDRLLVDDEGVGA